MKKFVIPVVIILLCGVGFLIYVLSSSYNRIQYEKDTNAHFIDIDTGGELAAEYNGVTTKVLGANVFKIKSSLTVSERERLFTKPEYDSDTAITLSFSDGATYVIAENVSEDDSVYIIYNYKGKSDYIKITGYKTFSWIEKSISPQGIYNENEIVQ